MSAVSKFLNRSETAGLVQFSSCWLDTCKSGMFSGLEVAQHRLQLACSFPPRPPCKEQTKHQTPSPSAAAVAQQLATERPNMGSGAAANTERGAGQGGPRHQKQPNSHAWKLTAWPAPGRKRAREAADRGGKIYAETKRASQIEEDRGA